MKRVLISALTLTAIAGPFAVLNSGCSLKDTADEMKDTSKSIEGYSQHLAKRTNDLEIEMTKKESFATFLERMQELFGESLKAEPSESDLLFSAGSAIESLLFQLWKGDYGQDLLDLDLRFKFSAEILFVKAMHYIPRDFDVDVIPAKAGPFEAVASLGSKLDRMSEEFSANLRRHNMPRVSLYDVIVTALQNRHATERHELFPRATDMILQYHSEAIYLLQLRHNFLPMMVLGRMGTLADRSSFSRLFMMKGWLLGDNRFGTTIDLNARDFPIPALTEWTTWLLKASSTRAALRAMGIEPQYNSKFSGILKQIDFGQKGLRQLVPSQISALERAQRDLAEAFTAVVQESQPPPVVGPVGAPVSPAPVGSAPVGSAPVGSAPLGSAPLGSGQTRTGVPGVSPTDKSNLAGDQFFDPRLFPKLVPVGEPRRPKWFDYETMTPNGRPASRPDASPATGGNTGADKSRD